jgi:hypothetical protein
MKSWTSESVDISLFIQGKDTQKDVDNMHPTIPKAE